MSAGLPRMMLALAVHILGARRHRWGMAMRAEFEAAREEGGGFGFAYGCLLAAARELPAYAEGRLALTVHALALGVMLPLAALLLAAAVSGYPYVSSAQRSVLNDGEVALAPALTLLMLALVLAQLLLAWFVAERDWARAIEVALFGGAALATLAPVLAMLRIDGGAMLLPLTAFAVEAAAMLALARWHASLPRAARLSG